jgi:hypothetical protein
MKHEWLNAMIVSLTSALSLGERGFYDSLVPGYLILILDTEPHRCCRSAPCGSSGKNAT